jgi:hypothetical protein
MPDGTLDQDDESSALEAHFRHRLDHSGVASVVRERNLPYFPGTYDLSVVPRRHKALRFPADPRHGVAVDTCPEAAHSSSTILGGSLSPDRASARHRAWSASRGFGRSAAHQAQPRRSPTLQFRDAVAMAATSPLWGNYRGWVLARPPAIRALEANRFGTVRHGAAGDAAKTAALQRARAD